jgi:2-polyprenyl-3-methyl-5-hydroxy-6-metoxy-1,4-benzoquinol methylase
MWEGVGTICDTYSVWAKNYHNFRLNVLRDIFINKLQIEKDTKILDIGCGSCIFREFLSPEECPEITAFDIDPAISNTHPITFIVDNAQKPALTGKWDIVYAGEVIEHLPSPNEAFIAWDRLLKPGGYMVVTTPNGLFPDQFEQHISLMSVSKMKKMFELHNYKIIEIMGNNFFIPFFDSLVKPLWRFEKLVDNLYDIKFKLPGKYGIMARNMIYIAQKQF